MVDALYGSIDDESARREFDSHVVDCEACAAMLAEMQGTLELMGKRERYNPGQAFWDGYWNRLSARMESEATGGSRKRVLAWWPSWAYRAAAVAAILAVGVFAGRTFFAPSTGVQESPQVSAADRGDEETSPTPAREQRDEVASGSSAQPREKREEPAPRDATDVMPASSERAMCYIEKSQMLLIALVNSDPNTPDAYAGLDEHRRRSSVLVAQAPEIKESLDDPKQRRLRGLVTELEKILIQISNLESEEDVEAVEFIRSRVSEHDMLFKINLEQMRHGLDDDGCAPGAAADLQRSI
jgi:hypothetical protein